METGGTPAVGVGSDVPSIGSPPVTLLAPSDVEAAMLVFVMDSVILRLERSASGL